MRTVALLLLTVLCLSLAADPLSPDDVCRRTVEAFRQRDFAVLLPVLFSLEDDAAFDSLFRQQAQLTEEEMTQYNVSRLDVQEDYRQNLMSMQQQFRKALDAADSLGIDWRKARYHSYNISSEGEWLGYRLIDSFTISIKQGKQEYHLCPGMLRETPNGWRLAAGQGCQFIWSR